MAPEHPQPPETRIAAPALSLFLARLFTDAGLPAHAAATMADALIEADLQGVASHGVQQAPIYLKRLRAGTISPATAALTVLDRGAVAVLDARSMLGHLAADQAMALAIAKARSHGAGVIAMRNSGHFGAAGRYVAAASRQGFVGIALCNAVPVIAAPGGVERLVGTNPLAIALPTDDPTPLVLDMAMSEAAFGRIRKAAMEGETIPANWALAADGTPTTDPVQALTGLLQPMAGHKGFGLAMMIDLICGLLSDGTCGAAVPGVYDDMDQPLSCSALFLAIDVGAFRDPGVFKRDAAAYADHIRHSARAAGTLRITVPGDGRAERVQASQGFVRLSRPLVEVLEAMARERGLPAHLAG